MKDPTTYHRAIKTASAQIQLNQPCSIEQLRSDNHIWRMWPDSHFSHTDYKNNYDLVKDNRTLKVKEKDSKSHGDGIDWYALEFVNGSAIGAITVPCYIIKTDTFAAKNIYEYEIMGKKGGGAETESSKSNGTAKRSNSEPTAVKRAKRQKVELEFDMDKFDFAKYADMDLGDDQKWYDLFMERMDTSTETKQTVKKNKYIRFKLAKLILDMPEADEIIDTIV